jgi:hypothetical protein
VDWVTGAERFFEVQNVKTSERLCLDFISMEGNEVHWFQFWRQTSKNASWDLGGVCDSIVAYRGERGTVYERLAVIR